MKILGLLGSKNKDGVGAGLLARALKATGAGTELVHLSEMPSVAKMHEKILSCDGIIISTPVHWFNVSVHVKKFIDEVLWRFSGEPYEINGIPVGIIATCNEDGANQAISQIVMPLNHCGFYVPPFGTLIHNLSMPSHGEDGWQDDAESIGKQIERHAKKLTKPL